MPKSGKERQAEWRKRQARGLLLFRMALCPAIHKSLRGWIASRLKMAKLKLKQNPQMIRTLEDLLKELDKYGG